MPLRQGGGRGGRTPNGKYHLKFPFWLLAHLPKSYMAAPAFRLRGGTHHLGTTTLETEEAGAAKCLWTRTACRSRAWGCLHLKTRNLQPFPGGHEENARGIHSSCENTVNKVCPPLKKNSIGHESWSIIIFRISSKHQPKISIQTKFRIQNIDLVASQWPGLSMHCIDRTQVW